MGVFGRAGEQTQDIWEHDRVPHGVSKKGIFPGGLAKNSKLSVCVCVFFNIVIVGEK